MNRQFSSKLLTWKDAPSRKPFLIKGARHCGKTWLMKTFGEENFADTAYFNFEEDPRLIRIFSVDLSPDRIIADLGQRRAKPIVPGTTLIILNEIQFCPYAITSLALFAQSMQSQQILCAASRSGIPPEKFTRR